MYREVYHLYTNNGIFPTLHYFLCLNVLAKVIMVISPVNNRTPKTLFTIIKDNCLSRSNCPCRVIKGYGNHLLVFRDVNRYTNILLPVTEFGSTVKIMTIPTYNIINPVNITSFEVSCIEVLIFIPLANVKNILLNILTNDEPRSITLLLPPRPRPRR